MKKKRIIYNLLQTFFLGLFLIGTASLFDSEEIQNVVNKLNNTKIEYKEATTNQKDNSVLRTKLAKNIETVANKEVVEQNENMRYLSDIDYIKDQSSVGWGKITLDQNLEPSYNNGLISLLVNGEKKTFLKGVSAHATSTLIYDISGYDYDYFSTYYGVDAGRGNNGNGVKFSIYTSKDGENWDLHTLASPPVKKGNTEAEFIKIDIKDKKYIKLYANNNGNDNSDHAVYANAKLYKEGYNAEEADKPYSFIKTIEEYDETLKNSNYEDTITNKEQILLQRKFVSCFGYDILQGIAHLDENKKATIEWIMTDIDALRYYVTGGRPLGSYMNSLNILCKLYAKYQLDLRDTTQTEYTTLGDLYKRMMITLSLTHSSSICLWIDNAQCSDAVTRYEIFKKMHKNGLLINSTFERLNIEEMRWVLDNKIDDEEIEWLNHHIRRYPTNSAPYNMDPYMYIAYRFGYNYNLPQYYSAENYDKWNKKYHLEDYNITYKAGKPKLWIVFEQGSVCGGLSKTGSNINGSLGNPSAVIGQPGHAAYLQYSKNAQGKGMWGIGNDVSGWTQSEKGERLLAGWGSNSWDSYYQVSYVPYTQEALNDLENYNKALETMLLIDSYKDDLEKKEEIYEKALEYQPINMDAWYGLIRTYQANKDKTPEDYINLVKRITENMSPFPLPMYDLVNLIKGNLEKTNYATAFNNYVRTSLEKGTILGTQIPTSITQPYITRIMANYLLGRNDYSIAKFSFDGQNANKIMLGSKFEGSGVRWDYSLDGGKTWKATSESSVLLSKKELEIITAENDIKIHLVGVDYSDINIYTIDIKESAGIPSNVFASDLENRLIGASNVMEWKLSEKENWTSFENELPDLTGNKTLIVRMKATGTHLASKNNTIYQFTKDNDSKNRKYIPVKHLSIQSVSTEATSNQGSSAFAIDANYNTRWHSAWNGTDTQRFIIIKLDEAKFISSVEYVPAGGGNGKIISGIVYGSVDGQEWIELSRKNNLTYPNNTDSVEQAIANIKDFDIAEPQKVQYIKIQVPQASNGNWVAARAFNLYEDTTIKTAAEFSFSGTNAGKLVLEKNFIGKSWKFSIDGGKSYKNVSQDIYELSSEEIEKINEEDNIKIKVDGDNTVYSIKIKKSAAPNQGYLNDWENRPIGLQNLSKLEWKIDNGSWKSYSDEEPFVEGNKKLYVRTKAVNNYTASDIVEYQFTNDNQPNTRKYIPIKNLTMHAYNSQSKDSSRPFYAVNSIDGNINTMWHSTFDQHLKNEGKKAYLVIKLNENKYISALEFIQRKYRDADPCFIKNSTVYVSLDGENWTEAGKLQNLSEQENEWRVINFKKSLEAQYVKLEMETYDMFASVSMINLFEDVTATKAAEFSLIGENANTISLLKEFKGKKWQYSIDGGKVWKNVSGNEYQLTTTEINQLTPENNIKVRFDGSDKIYTINLSKATAPKIDSVYLNDLENRLIGLNNVNDLEWKIEKENKTSGNWKNYSEEEPIVTGNSKLIIRAKGDKLTIPSETVEFQFTEDNQPNTRKYIPIKNLTMHAYNSQSKDSSRPYYAVNAIDGNINTMWHSTFDQHLKNEGKNAYLVIKLNKAKNISALEFIQRKYKINDPCLIKNAIAYVSMDGINWTEAGKLENISQEDDTLRAINFERSKEAQYVKLEMVTYDMFSAISMINLYEDLSNIDTTKPTAKIKYSITTPTNQNVIATLVNPSEEITITNNNGKNTYTFTKNGEFTFEFVDKDGNKGTAIAKVTNIDKIVPTATVSYSTVNPTNQNVVVTLVEASEEIAITNNNGKNTYTFTKNGEFTFEFVDKAGNKGTAKAIVNNIDKTVPAATVSYSTVNPTNQNVVVTLVEASEEITITNNNGKNTYTFTKNGEFTFEFVDKAGNKGTAKAIVNNIDKTVPTATVSYSTIQPTNQNVVATLTVDKDITITNNNGKKTYTFTENGEFTFEFVDKAGNKGTAIAKVTNIDKIVPTAEVIYSTIAPTNQDVVATLVNTSEEITIISEGGNTHTFTENGEFTFEFVDRAGNKGSVKAVVNNIDKAVPTAKVIYSTIDPTNQDVIATLIVENGIKITNNNGKNTYTFTKNGEFTFEFVDKAGNKGTAKAVVNNINKTVPTGTISYSTTQPTNQNVVATLTVDKDVTITNNGGKNTYTFTENGEFTFEFVDKAGNKGTAIAKVTNIDKIVPTAEVIYSTIDPTNQDVIVTLTGESEEITIISEGGTTHTFTKNGTFTFEFIDKAGNKGSVTAIVNNIKKIAPTAEVIYSTIDPTNQDVIATLKGISEEIIITNNDGKNTYTFTGNGTFTFEFKDVAGNIGSFVAIVNNIDKTAPTASVKYSTTTLTNKEVIATLEEASEEIIITNNDGKNTYTFTENGSFTFEYVDKAGNKGSTIATITWIDKTTLNKPTDSENSNSDKESVTNKITNSIKSHAKNSDNSLIQSEEETKTKLIEEDIEVNNKEKDLKDANLKTSRKNEDKTSLTKEKNIMKLYKFIPIIIILIFLMIYFFIKSKKVKATQEEK